MRLAPGCNRRARQVPPGAPWATPARYPGRGTQTSETPQSTVSYCFPGFPGPQGGFPGPPGSVLRRFREGQRRLEKVGFPSNCLACLPHSTYPAAASSSHATLVSSHTAIVSSHTAIVEKTNGTRCYAALLRCAGRWKRRGRYLPGGGKVPAKGGEGTCQGGPGASRSSFETV